MERRHKALFISAILGMALLAAMVGIARRATWASRLSAFVLRFLPNWAWLKQASGALFFALNTVFSLFSWLTPGSVGIAEGAYAGIFSVMGLPIDGAVAFGLAQKAASLPIVALGILYLSRRGAGWLGRRRIEYDRAGSS